MFSLTDTPNDLDFAPGAAAVKEVFRQSCFKCAGSGVWRPSQSFFGVAPGRKCFACDGKGFKEFATSPDKRAAAKASAERRAAAGKADNLTAFMRDFPAETAWMNANGNTFEFAASMVEAVMKYGSLTDGQMNAVHKCMTRAQERAAAKAQAVQAVEARSQAIEIDRVAEAFAKAKAAGLKAPKLTFAAFVFKPAKETGRNPGAIYVTGGDEGAYLGKVMGGKFLPSRDCTPATQSQVVAVCADPLAEAIAHGKATGRCCCCNRELTDPVSIARGIGPICEGKFF